MPDHLNTIFYGVRDSETFYASMQSVLNSVSHGSVFTGDNLFTYGKNLSFLSDEGFMSAFTAHSTEPQEQAVIWRVYTLCWAARRCLGLAGDFVECGSYRGTTARIIADYLDFGSAAKRFLLFDVYDDEGQTALHGYPALAGDLHGFVSSRFTDFDNVDVIKGWIPQILAGNTPSEIAFLHIDMNNAEAETGALAELFDRVVPGGSIVLDDYGWSTYHEQKAAEDLFFGDRGYQVLELPTGQGLVIK